MKRIAVVGIVWLLGLAPAASAQNSWPTNGWAMSTPEAENMDATLVAAARDHALTGGGAGIITRHGRAVMTWGDIETQLYDLEGASMSVGATLLGAAIRIGDFTLDDSAQAHYPDFGSPPNSNFATGWLDDITFRQLASHSSGFDTAPGYVDLSDQPGTTWHYGEGGVNWLADTLHYHFGGDLRGHLLIRFIGPLGLAFSDLSWRDSPHRGPVVGGVPGREFGAGISLTCDAMARFGYLFLREGTWDGTMLLAADFVSEVRQPDPALAALSNEDPTAFPNATSHYGLLWWNNADGTIADVPTDAYWAWGLGEALIVVIPSLDIVAARAGGGWRSGWDADYSVLEPFLQPLAQSATMVSNEDTSWSKLKSRWE